MGLAPFPASANPAARDMSIQVLPDGGWTGPNAVVAADEAFRAPSQPRSLPCPSAEAHLPTSSHLPTVARRGARRHDCTLQRRIPGAKVHVARRDRWLCRHPTRFVGTKEVRVGFEDAVSTVGTPEFDDPWLA